jgi:hypothetical protein
VKIVQVTLLSRSGVVEVRHCAASAAADEVGLIRRPSFLLDSVIAHWQ